MLELVISIALLSAMILVFLSLGNVLRNITFVKTFQKDVASQVFDDYRMALYVISRRDWLQIDKLNLGSAYHIYFDDIANQWQIAFGSTTTKSGLNQYKVYFFLNNFENNPDIKIVTTTAVLHDSILQDAFLLPKTK